MISILVRIQVQKGTYIPYVVGEFSTVKFDPQESFQKKHFRIYFICHLKTQIYRVFIHKPWNTPPTPLTSRPAASLPLTFVLTLVFPKKWKTFDDQEQNKSYVLFCSNGGNVIKTYKGLPSARFACQLPPPHVIQHSAVMYGAMLVCSVNGYGS